MSQWGEYRWFPFRNSFDKWWFTVMVDSNFRRGKEVSRGKSTQTPMHQTPAFEAISNIDAVDRPQKGLFGDITKKEGF